VISSGTGRFRLDDDIVEVGVVVFCPPHVVREWEAGDDGLEILAFGPRRADDHGEMLQDWWQD